MVTYTITRDGATVSEHKTHLDAIGALHRLQGQSVEWATTHEGWAIEETTKERGEK